MILARLHGPLGSLVAPLALGCVVASCADDPPVTDLRVLNPYLSVGVYGECELPSGLKGVVGQVTQALGAAGLELGGEVIFVYDYDLASKAQTLELLVGGQAGLSIAHYLGGGAHSAADGLPGGGALVSATIPINWNGSLKQVTWGVDAFDGVDVFAGEAQGGGGSWKAVWSSNPKEAGESGYWGSAGASVGGACSAGGVVFTSNSDLCVIKGWLSKVFGTSNSTSCTDAGQEAGQETSTEGGEEAGMEGGSEAGGMEGGEEAGGEGGSEAGDEGGGGEGGNDGGAEAASGEGGGGEGGYAFLFADAPQHHAFRVAEGESETMDFSWRAAVGAAPPADLWVEADGRTLLQVSAVGDRPFVRSGLDVTPIAPNVQYRLVLERVRGSLHVRMSEPSRQTKDAALVDLTVGPGARRADGADAVDVVLPATSFRAAIDSNSL